jgi:hypothetical protein
MTETQTIDRQRLWYSEENNLTSEKLINKIKDKGKMNVIDTGVILAEYYTNSDEKGLGELINAVIKNESDGKNLNNNRVYEKAKAFAHCKLFWISQIANGYLENDIDNISCNYIAYDAFAKGEVSDFYKKNALGFDPIAALPFAEKLFRGNIHPASKRFLEDMKKYESLVKKI